MGATYSLRISWKSFPLDMFRIAEYAYAMILSFRCRETEKLFYDLPSRAFRQIERIARRKLLLLHNTRSLDDLRVPPGNRLEALRGDRVGEFSIRINDQWRICFHWEDGNATEVEIVDYH